VHHRVPSSFNWSLAVPYTRLKLNTHKKRNTKCWIVLLRLTIPLFDERVEAVYIHKSLYCLFITKNSLLICFTYELYRIPKSLMWTGGVHVIPSVKFLLNHILFLCS